MKNEIWKDIEGYEGIYQVSNLGQVRSLDRYTEQVGLQGSTFERFRRGTIIKQTPNKRGYLMVGLYDASVHKKRRLYVHRLVAFAFVPGYSEDKEVNHKDEVITNNHADNLEWITQRENLNYGTRGYRVNKNRSVGVEQYDTEGHLIATFKSMNDAERETGIYRNSIKLCCQGKTKTAKGYRWRYTEE
jgi:hypothetical protein